LYPCHGLPVEFQQALCQWNDRKVTDTEVTKIKSTISYTSINCSESAVHKYAFIDTMATFVLS